jgi:hypothetical protein
MKLYFLHIASLDHLTDLFALANLPDDTTIHQDIHSVQHLLTAFLSSPHSSVLQPNSFGTLDISITVLSVTSSSFMTRWGSANDPTLLDALLDKARYRGGLRFRPRKLQSTGRSGWSG